VRRRGRVCGALCPAWERAGVQRRRVARCLRRRPAATCCGPSEAPIKGTPLACFCTPPRCGWCSAGYRRSTPRCLSAPTTTMSQKRSQRAVVSTEDVGKGVRGGRMEASERNRGARGGRRRKKWISNGRGRRRRGGRTAGTSGKWQDARCGACSCRRGGADGGSRGRRGGCREDRSGGRRGSKRRPKGSGRPAPPLGDATSLQRDSVLLRG